MGHTSFIFKIGDVGGRAGIIGVVSRNLPESEFDVSFSADHTFMIGTTEFTENNFEIG